MRKILWDSVRFRLERSPEGQVPRVLPFPGVYPTRWKIDLRYTFKKRRLYAMDERPDAPKYDQRFEYFGKPTTQVANRVNYIIQHATGRGNAAEFDRAGVFMTATFVMPRLTVAVSDWIEGKARFYYPWMYTNGFMVTPWGGRIINRAVLLWNGHRTVLYTQKPQEQLTADEIGEHKQWLEYGSLAWGKSPLI